MNSENKIFTNLFDNFKHENKLQFELIIRSIKMLDIGYITVIYFIFAVIIAKIFNYIFGIYSPEYDKHKSTIKIGVELCAIIWLIGISTYIVRNIVELIPSPFEDVYDFHHKKVKELSSATVYTLILYQCLSYFKGKLTTFIERTF
jgi:tetrahydromethanopterin S-methyltransferase subunit C